MALKMNLRCPVCQHYIVVTMDGETWGTVEVTDQGCGSVTLFGSAVNDHMNEHASEERHATVQKHYATSLATAEAFLARFPLNTPVT